MVRIRVDDAATADDGAELWPAYDAVFHDHDSYDSWRENVWDRHRARGGFRLARAHTGDSLVGFGYGYTGWYGQWWTDRAAEVLDPEVAEVGWEGTSSWSASVCSTLLGAPAPAALC